MRCEAVCGDLGCSLVIPAVWGFWALFAYWTLFAYWALLTYWALSALCAVFTVITFQWYFWGYSLAFSQYATNGYIGDLQKFGLMKTLGAPSPGSPLIPDLLYAFYQVSADGWTHHNHAS